MWGLAEASHTQDKTSAQLHSIRTANSDRGEVDVGTTCRTCQALAPNSGALHTNYLLQ